MLQGQGTCLDLFKSMVMVGWNPKMSHLHRRRERRRTRCIRRRCVMYGAAGLYRAGRALCFARCYDQLLREFCSVSPTSPNYSASDFFVGWVKTATNFAPGRPSPRGPQWARAASAAWPQRPHRSRRRRWQRKGEGQGRRRRERAGQGLLTPRRAAGELADPHREMQVAAAALDPRAESPRRDDFPPPRLPLEEVAGRAVAAVIERRPPGQRSHRRAQLTHSGAARCPSHSFDADGGDIRRGVGRGTPGVR